MVFGYSTVGAASAVSAGCLLIGGAEYVLGVDLCEPLINAARELQTGKDSYRVADVEDLSFLTTTV